MIIEVASGQEDIISTATNNIIKQRKGGEMTGGEPGAPQHGEYDSEPESHLIAEPVEGTAAENLQVALRQCRAARQLAMAEGIDPLTADHLLLAEQGLRLAIERSAVPA